jgi:hypothetical protein
VKGVAGSRWGLVHMYMYMYSLFILFPCVQVCSRTGVRTVIYLGRQLLGPGCARCVVQGPWGRC